MLIQPLYTLQLQTFNDANWATDHDNRRSIGVYYVYLGSNLISWSFKQQHTITRSSTEAEYKAFTNIVAETQRLKSLLIDLHVLITPSLIIWCDNIGATYLFSNPLFYAHTKHIKIDFHFVRDQVIHG